MQDLSGDGSATQGWNQQLHLHLHASPCVPVWPMPPCFVCLHRPPMPFPAATGGKVLSPPSRPGDTLSRALQAQGHLPTILIPTPPSLLVLYSSSSSAEQAASREQTFLPQSHSNTSAVAPTAMPLSHHNLPPLQQGPPSSPSPLPSPPMPLLMHFPLAWWFLSATLGRRQGRIQPPPGIFQAHVPTSCTSCCIWRQLRELPAGLSCLGTRLRCESRAVEPTPAALGHAARLIYIP